MASTGMIIDGVLGSQCVDSSGEVLDIEGADISDLEEGRGVLNYEHKGAEDRDSNGQEIVGKIVMAKKVMKEADCDNARQRAYWKKTKSPFIYGVCRLYDGAGHEGAKALAAQIRDHHANSEPILVRFSVEGSTLEKDGNVLKRSVIRRVALTLKPCNRTSDSGLLEDPGAPKGFDAKPTQRVGDILADLADDARKMEHEHPGYQRLGGVIETEYLAFEETDHRSLVKALVKLKAIRKTLTAGSPGGAPSSLVQGEALQREDVRGKITPAWKDRAMKTLKSYLDKNQDFNRAELVKVLKRELPEASDDFINHFAGIAEDYTVKLRKAGEDPFPKLNPEAHPENTEVDRAGETPGAVKPKVKGGLEIRTGGETMLPNKKRVAGEPTPRRLKLQQHFPDDHHYQAIMDPARALKLGHIDEDTYQHIVKTVHEPWHRAMTNWLPLNNALREGKVPKGIIAKAMIFAAMSPNTSVPNQELFYGHYMDMLHAGKVDPFRPFTEDNVNEFTERSTNGILPEWNRDHYENHRPEKYGQTGSDEDDKGDLPQIRGLRSAHLLFPRLEHLTAKYRDDTQGIASELMQLKAEHKRKTKRVHPDTDGYGPKLTRYMLGMFGGGNMIVPDRHMVRSTFDLELEPDPSRANKFKGSPELEKLQTQVVTKPHNEPFLRAIDHNFFTKHPAVQQVLQTFPKHFQGREQQAIFPAFWLHWLAIGHHDRMRGRAFQGFNGDSDHRVFWDSVQDEMIKHGLHQHPMHDRRPGLLQEDDSFDFGHNAMAKAEGTDPWPRHGHHLDHPVWLKAAGAMEAIRQKWGETPALMAFFSHIAPKLMAAETPVPPVAHAPHPAYHPHLMKAEALMINLRKAMADVQQAQHPIVTHLAPHIQHVYKFQVGQDRKITRHLSGRFMTLGGHMHVLEDYHGDLKALTQGPLHAGHQQQIQALQDSHSHEVVPLEHIHAGARPELWPTPGPTPARPGSSFEYRRHGQEQADHLEFKDGRPHLNGHGLDQGQLQALMHHVKNGHASVRYKQDMGSAVQKMEQLFEILTKGDGSVAATATKVHEGLSFLDRLEKLGAIPPELAQEFAKHKENFRTVTMRDTMDPRLGNKLSHMHLVGEDGSNETGGIHISMDGNDFKTVNDRYGHAEGDKAIKAMSEALHQARLETIGETNGSLFRAGGDEFAAHFDTHDEAARFIRAAQKHLDRITPIQGQHKLSMGFGLGTNFKAADLALNEAKKQKYTPESMAANPLETRKWQSRHPAGQAPHLAHSAVPGFEGPIPLDHTQLQVKPPPAPEPQAPAPEPVVHTPALPAPAGPGSGLAPAPKPS
jgi:GGDEF domain-containing protein